MMVQLDSLGLVKFERKAIKRNKSLVDEVLQKKVTDEKASREGNAKELVQLRSSVAASDALAAKLAESKISLELIHAELVLLKERVAREDTEIEDTVKVVPEGREESKRRMVRLNVALVSRNP